jgi:ribonuclease D
MSTQEPVTVKKEEPQTAAATEPVISRDFINALPPIQFEGEIVLVDTAAKVDETVARLCAEPRIGFDTESKPSFTRGTSHPVCLVQLATDSSAYLIQLFKTGFPPSLIELLSTPDMLKIGVGLDNDTSKLLRWHPFKPAGFYDLGKAAANRGIPQLGARSLTARFLEHRLIKSSQRTDWSRPQLTGKQMVYAATDAWVCLKLYSFLSGDTKQLKPPKADAGRSHHRA